MSTAEITRYLGVLAARGITVAASPSRTLQARPGSLLTDDDRARLRECAGAILAHLGTPVTNAGTITLSGNEPWNSGVALKLMEEADALVERFGVDGRHPDVQLAAALVCSARAAKDMETLRLACREFEVALRRLAAHAHPRR